MVLLTWWAVARDFGLTAFFMYLVIFLYVELRAYLFSFSSLMYCSNNQNITRYNLFNLKTATTLVTQYIHTTPTI